MFSAANGARADVPHIIIIITDGESSDRALTKHQADLTRQQGIQVNQRPRVCSDTQSLYQAPG